MTAEIRIRVHDELKVVVGSELLRCALRLSVEKTLAEYVPHLQKLAEYERKVKANDAVARLWRNLDTEMPAEVKKYSYECLKAYHNLLCKLYDGMPEIPSDHRPTPRG